jgi:pyridoxamine 5'-phosphate oxidase
VSEGVSGGTANPASPPGPGNYLPADPPSDPAALLTEWLPPNDSPDRPQLILSTIDPTGHPDARTVLLSEFDLSGFYFHTDSRSRKVEDITANPAVALTLLWPSFTRQLVVQGRAEVAPADELADAYRRRSPYLKQLAWLNSLEFAQLPLAERREQWSAFRDVHAPGGTPEFDQPDTWIGFLVRPHRLTFWGSDPDAASRRAEYTLVDGEWVLEFLAG